MSTIRPNSTFSTHTVILISATTALLVFMVQVGKAWGPRP